MSRIDGAGVVAVTVTVLNAPGFDSLAMGFGYFLGALAFFYMLSFPVYWVGRMVFGGD